MKTGICPKCRKEICIEETKNKGEFVFSSHLRMKPNTENEEDGISENVHLRNIVDIPCEGSGKNSSI
ncbi:MAG: hypothetical protein QG583_834 [Patescibacteria group bacterium]|nr:hypothetical protein [Patescibacteria group bacterium]